MKRVLTYMATALLIVLGAGCERSDIPEYDIANSAVNFKAKSFSYSLKGMTESTRLLNIPVTLVGQVSDHDRPINVAVIDDERNTAVENQDFRIVEATIAAGALSGNVVIEVNKLKDVDLLTTTLNISSNDEFRDGIPAYSTAVVVWSEQYVRPKSTVWQYWWLYMSKGYSRAYHKLLISVFGEEFELSTASRKAATEDETLVYHIAYWWFDANRTFRRFVEDHDRANPDSPYMHSEDYEHYSNREIAVGNGTKPDVLPTILETLNSI